MERSNIDDNVLAISDDVVPATKNEAVNMQVYPQSPPGVNTASITNKQLF